MQNPEKRLNGYLDRIVDEVALLDENLRSLKNVVDEVRKNDNEEFIQCYGYLSYSIYNLLFDNLVLNLSWMFEADGKRSLIWFLRQLAELSDDYYRSLAEQVVDYEPEWFASEQSKALYIEMKTRYSLDNKEKKQCVKEIKASYQAKIDTHLAQIELLDSQYQRLKGARDKSIAHRDKQAFDDPEKFWESNRLSIEDIESLTNIAIEIVRDAFGIMRDQDLVLLQSRHIGLDSLLWQLKKCHNMELEYSQHKPT